MRLAVVFVLLASVAGCTTGDPSTASVTTRDAATGAAERISAAAIRAHMQFLADDALEGRGTGTRGHELAAKYMAAQFEALGLAPAGDGGSYFQRVPLRSTSVDGAQSSVSFRYPDREESLTFATEWTAPGDPGRDDVSVEAPVVFVGAGVTAPDQNYDDYRGIDATGKIVAWVYPTPPFESTVKAHYSSNTVRRANAAAHGAVGWIHLSDPVLEKLYPFAMIARDNRNPGFNWLDRNGRPNDYLDAGPRRRAGQHRRDAEAVRGQRPPRRGRVCRRAGRQGAAVRHEGDGAAAQGDGAAGRRQPERGGEARRLRSGAEERVRRLHGAPRSHR